MSRHELTSKNPGVTEAAGGWDGPMKTFFYQQTKTIIIEGDEVDDTDFIIGGNTGESQDIDVFLETLKLHAEIPLGFREQLLDDRDAMPHNPNRPAYRHGIVPLPS